MLVFPSLLVSAAEAAGIPVPPDEILDEPDKFRESHPQFFVFCAVQLARRMAPGEHWDNAKAIAKIPVEELKKMTVQDLQAHGVKTR